MKPPNATEPGQRRCPPWNLPRGRAAALLLLAIGATGAAQARVVEEQFDLPVDVVDAWGKAVAQPIRVTVWRDDAATAPQPLLVINHGRATTAQQRADYGRVRYSDNARWFAQRGFVVAVPTRIGYGISGGEDVEDSGACSERRYPAVYRAAARQTQQLIEAMRQRPGVAAERTVVLGQSFGGATTVAVAAAMLPGVAVGINFAGGGGGDPKTHPDRPCSPHRLESLFADYGRTARVPMLWVYTENDHFFGPTLPREWAEAFRRAGGLLEFVQFPPHGEDGHHLFTAGTAVWRPTVADFLRRQGYAMPEPAGSAPAPAASPEPVR